MEPFFLVERIARIRKNWVHKHTRGMCAELRKYYRSHSLHHRDRGSAGKFRPFKPSGGRG